VNELTPRQIVEELDRYIIGQPSAKRAVAIALRNRWRRQQLDESMRRDVTPKNILMIGPTGVGKTEIARRLASLTGAPFIKVEATKYTEVGYHGRDVESMIRDLLDSAIAMERDRFATEMKSKISEEVDRRLVDALLPGSEEPAGDIEAERSSDRTARTREKLLARLRNGELDEREIEIGVEQRATVVGVLGQAGMDLDFDTQRMLEKMMPSRRETRRVRVKEAREVFRREAVEQLIDPGTVARSAVERVEQQGIIFLDEIDKVAGAERAQGPDVSRQGVQRDLLPIVEGTTVMTRHGPVRTDHILFIAAGAFHQSKPSDLMPELQGRFPIRVELSDLTRDDFVRILREPRNSLLRQQVELLACEGVELRFTDDAVEELARLAYEVNRKSQNIGARRLYTVMERVMEPVSFDAPDLRGSTVTIDGRVVRERVEGPAGDDELSKYIL
jgi:ATP-dependent HslUV protease ATP-binding subunit HslU